MGYFAALAGGVVGGFVASYLFHATIHSDLQAAHLALLDGIHKLEAAKKALELGAARVL